MIVAPGTNSISVDVFFADDTGAAVTGKVAADFPACKWSAGDNTADTTITLSDLAAITTAHPNNNTAGGVHEREGGWFRLDLPNNMFTSAGRKTLTFAEAANKRIIAPFIDVQNVASSLVSTGLDNVVMSDISAVPAINGSIKQAINWVFALFRNKRIETASTETVYKDDGSTPLATSAKSDDGTTFTSGEYS